jgi:hydrogenase nickel incorporation protein HypA/HybF
VNEPGIKAVMHEMSVAISIVDAVCETARKDGALSVSRIELVVGRLAGIQVESLRFCFSSAAKGTLAEDAVLAVEEPEARGECGDCGSRFPVSFFYAECPVCRSLKVRIVSGEEFMIQSIIIEEGE